MAHYKATTLLAALLILSGVIQSVVRQGLTPAGLEHYKAPVFPSQCQPEAPCAKEFPADQSWLLAARNEQRVEDMRAHVWYLYQHLVAPADGGAAAPPVWRTWYDKCDVFTNLLNSKECSNPPKDANSLPTHLRFPVELTEPTDPAVGVKGHLLALINEREETLYDAAFYRHVRQFHLSGSKDLDERRAAFNSAPLPEQAIPPFPRTAIVVKAFYVVLRPSGGYLNEVPYLDREKYRPSRRNETNPITGWPIAFKVDTITDQPCTPPSSAGQVHLSCFYWYRTTDNVDSYYVLVGLHIITKETPDWVWATFWWHPLSDTVTARSVYEAGQPDVKAVPPPWRYYLMDTTMSSESPAEKNPCLFWEGKDCGKKIVYNPYLEGQVAGGTLSNCLACHQKAVYYGERDRTPDQSVRRGRMQADDSYFENGLKTDYLWSVTDNAAAQDQGQDK